jgi:hypothetical protein
MPQAKESKMSNRADIIKELFTEARIEALNTALADLGIAAENVVTIFQVPGQALVSPTPAQFRVLYRV